MEVPLNLIPQFHKEFPQFRKCFPGFLTDFDCLPVCFHFVPCTFQGKSPDFDEVMNLLEQFEIFPCVNPVALFVFFRTQFREFGFPETYEGSIDRQDFRHFADGIILFFYRFEKVWHIANPLIRSSRQPAS